MVSGCGFYWMRCHTTLHLATTFQSIFDLRPQLQTPKITTILFLRRLWVFLSPLDIISRDYRDQWLNILVHNQCGKRRSPKT